uniref:Uncharacterized protein n=1 Tax=Polytomella parva TaxID=51329 RepID=A0A7S0UZU7_9CHLO|mmetsp:Transcript_27178/g.50100  ORF Transcript_27178/g.50100 Transcript_27178/m.50100 type:complete len:704 (+) Transcript_27178:247-2358(+)
MKGEERMKEEEKTKTEILFVVNDLDRRDESSLANPAFLDPEMLDPITVLESELDLDLKDEEAEGEGQGEGGAQADTPSALQGISHRRTFNGGLTMSHVTSSTVTNSTTDRLANTLTNFAGNSSHSISRPSNAGQSTIEPKLSGGLDTVTLTVSRKTGVVARNNPNSFPGKVVKRTDASPLDGNVHRSWGAKLNRAGSSSPTSSFFSEVSGTSLQSTNPSLSVNPSQQPQAVQTQPPSLPTQQQRSKSISQKNPQPPNSSSIMTANPSYKLSLNSYNSTGLTEDPGSNASTTSYNNSSSFNNSSYDDSNVLSSNNIDINHANNIYNSNNTNSASLDDNNGVVAPSRIVEKSPSPSQSLSSSSASIRTIGGIYSTAPSNSNAENCNTSNTLTNANGTAETKPSNGHGSIRISNNSLGHSLKRSSWNGELLTNSNSPLNNGASNSSNSGQVEDILFAANGNSNRNLNRKDGSIMRSTVPSSTGRIYSTIPTNLISNPSPSPNPNSSSNSNSIATTTYPSFGLSASSPSLQAATSQLLAMVQDHSIHQPYLQTSVLNSKPDPTNVNKFNFSYNSNTNNNGNTSNLSSLSFQHQQAPSSSLIRLATFPPPSPSPSSSQPPPPLGTDNSFRCPSPSSYPTVAGSLIPNSTPNPSTYPNVTNAITAAAAAAAGDVRPTEDIWCKRPAAAAELKVLFNEDKLPSKADDADA